jgi:hypothetical protein
MFLIIRLDDKFPKTLISSQVKSNNFTIRIANIINLARRFTLASAKRKKVQKQLKKY